MRSKAEILKEFTDHTDTDLILEVLLDIRELLKVKT